jgi:hypothetical protein
VPIRRPVAQGIVHRVFQRGRPGGRQAVIKGARGCPWC